VFYILAAGVIHANNTIKLGENIQFSILNVQDKTQVHFH